MEKILRRAPMMEAASPRPSPHVHVNREQGNLKLTFKRAAFTDGMTGFSPMVRVRIAPDTSQALFFAPPGAVGNHRGLCLPLQHGKQRPYMLADRTHHS